MAQRLFLVGVGVPPSTAGTAYFFLRLVAAFLTTFFFTARLTAFFFVAFLTAFFFVAFLTAFLTARFFTAFLTAFFLTARFTVFFLATIRPPLNRGYGELPLDSFQFAKSRRARFHLQLENHFPIFGMLFATLTSCCANQQYGYQS
jgi:hypothetical protein